MSFCFAKATAVRHPAGCVPHPSARMILPNPAPQFNCEVGTFDFGTFRIARRATRPVPRKGAAERCQRSRAPWTRQRHCPRGRGTVRGSVPGVRPSVRLFGPKSDEPRTGRARAAVLRRSSARRRAGKMDKPPPHRARPASRFASPPPVLPALPRRRSLRTSNRILGPARDRRRRAGATLPPPCPPPGVPTEFSRRILLEYKRIL